MRGSGFRKAGRRDNEPASTDTATCARLTSRPPRRQLQQFNFHGEPYPNPPGVRQLPWLLLVARAADAAADHVPGSGRPAAHSQHGRTRCTTLPYPPALESTAREQILDDVCGIHGVALAGLRRAAVSTRPQTESTAESADWLVSVACQSSAEQVSGVPQAVQRARRQRHPSPYTAPELRAGFHDADHRFAYVPGCK